LVEYIKGKIMKIIQTIFGLKVKAVDGKLTFIRKRIFHKGYQISSISIDKVSGEEIYILLEEVDSIQEVQKYLGKN